MSCKRKIPGEKRCVWVPDEEPAAPVAEPVAPVTAAPAPKPRKKYTRRGKRQ